MPSRQGRPNLYQGGEGVEGNGCCALQLFTLYLFYLVDKFVKTNFNFRTTLSPSSTSDMSLSGSAGGSSPPVQLTSPAPPPSGLAYHLANVLPPSLGGSGGANRQLLPHVSTPQVCYLGLLSFREGGDIGVLQ